jgi:hypothetical protein
MNSFTKLDQFGQKINLNFENRPEFKTSFGAIASVLMFLILLAFGAADIQKITSGDIKSIITTENHFNYEN